jgi:hypothetical protein
MNHRIFLVLTTLSLMVPSLPAEPAPALPPDICCTDDGIRLISAYVVVARALAADDLKGAIDRAEDLGLWAECRGQEVLDDAVADLERSRNLAEARIAFRDISTQVIRLARWFPGYYVMTCPEAKADWIQIDPEVANPYYGSKNLRCGKIKESIGMPPNVSPES